MADRVHRGGCLCGSVSFEAEEPLRHVIACHCSQCRRTSGHFWAATSVPLGRFRLTRESAALRWFRSSPAATRGFCSDLGISMSLKAHGATEADLRPWAEEAHGIRRLMDNNPRDMSVDDVEAIYRAAF